MYEIRLKETNSKHIITGIYLPYQADVTLPTRKLKGVFDIGLTIEESLYFFAFGVLKVEVKKIEDSNLVRESIKTQIHNMLKKKGNG